jgi:hypothetical protein
MLLIAMTSYVFMPPQNLREASNRMSLLIVMEIFVASWLHERAYGL